MPIALLVLLPLFIVVGGRDDDSRRSSLRQAAGSPVVRPGAAVFGKHGMVVSASARASRVGIEILRAGGNAVDAAVAVGFALAVTYPSAGNIGGGSLLVIRMADGREAAIDARETAPRAATRTMYLDSAGIPIRDRSLRGPLAAGVPGTVDGLLAARDAFGSFALERLLRPAIALAAEGYTLAAHEASFLRFIQPQFSAFPSSLRVYTRDGRCYTTGERFRQPDLAAALQRIARDGRAGFYTGETADRIVEEMRRGGGIITHADLSGYRSVRRAPLHGTYRGQELITMPPPSAGGASLIQMLNILEGYPLGSLGLQSAESVHRIIEAERRAFADRTAFFGDPDFVRVPVDSLTAKSTADLLRAGIHPGRATRSDDIHPDLQYRQEGTQTTHYSVVDRWGNAVAVTTTLNSVCGSKCVVDGAGFLLNNEMDDFSVKPGAPNQYGLLGSDVNAIEPGKRMLSSMTPTIVCRDGRPVILLGSPGGSTIPTTVLQVLLNIIDYHLPVDSAVALPRFHHQWMPDSVFLEAGALGGEVVQQLVTMGHFPKEGSPLGRVEAILYDSRRRGWVGCSDPRGHGAAVGY